MISTILYHSVSDFTLFTHVETTPDLGQVLPQSVCIINITKLFELWQVGILSLKCFGFLELDLL